MKLGTFSFVVFALFLSFLVRDAFGSKNSASAEPIRIPKPRGSKRHHLSSTHKRGKSLRRKKTENAIARDLISAKETSKNGLNLASTRNYEEIQRLINCKVATVRSTIESRFVLCNGKRHKVSPKIRKILRELGTRRDMFPFLNNQNENVGSILYGKPISSFLDDPSLPQTSTNSPHQKYPGLGLFDPGLRSTGNSQPGEVLNLPSGGSTTEQPEAPGEDTPQLAPPEQPNVEVGSLSTKSENPKEDLKKKFGFEVNKDDSDESDDQKDDDDQDDNDGGIDNEQEEENQYKAMQASKLNRGEMSDIESFLHETNPGTSSESSDSLGASHYGAVLNQNEEDGEPKYGGSGPEESKDSAVREAMEEREKDAARVSQEERKAVTEQSNRESNEEKLKTDIATEAENIASKDTSSSAVNNEVNTLGTAGVASDDEMTTSTPIGSIWSSLQNTFYATTQSQLGEMDPTSNTIGRQKVHKPLLRPHSLQVTKPVQSNVLPPKTNFHRKLLGKALKMSPKVTMGTKRGLGRKIKKTDISKDDEALVPLDVVRNLLLQSKDVQKSTENTTKHEKRTKILRGPVTSNTKRYVINGVRGPTLVPSVPSFGPSNFMQLGFPQPYGPMSTSGQIFPVPLGNVFPGFLPQPLALGSRDGIFPPFAMEPFKEQSGYYRDQIPPSQGSYGFEQGLHISGQFAPFFSAMMHSAPQGMSFFSAGQNRGKFRGFVSVPIVEPVPIYRGADSSYRLPYSRSVSVDTLRPLSVYQGHSPTSFESITSPQKVAPPWIYEEPTYNPHETESFHPDGEQPDPHPGFHDPYFREALRDAEEAHQLAMGHTRGYNKESKEYTEEKPQEGPGYKRSDETTSKSEKTEGEVISGSSAVEKEDGRIVFTKEHVGFGPIVVEAKTAKAALKDNDDDDDDD